MTEIDFLPATQEELKKLIADRVSTGRYSTSDEVVLDAFRALDEREACEGVWRGLQDVKEGRVKSVEDSFAKIRSNLGLSTKE